MATKHAILVSYDSARELEQIFERCRPSVERYADVVGADLLIKKSQKVQHCFGKYELVLEAVRAGYEKVLQLDADIYIHTDQDIFAETADSVFAARSTDRVPPDELWYGDWREDWTWNGGVLVAQPSILEAYIKFASFHQGKYWSDEATLIPYLEFAKVKVYSLPGFFNEWVSPTNGALHAEWRGFAHFSGDQKLDRWQWFESRYLCESQPA